MVDMPLNKETKPNHLIPAKRLNLVLINKEKKNLSYSGFCCASGLQSENKRKGKDS